MTLTMLRIVFYSHDTYGLGHFRRCLKLAWALKERLPKVEGFFLSGSPWTDVFRLPDGFEVVRMPAVIKRGPNEYTPRDGATHIDELVSERSRTVQNSLADFQPDLFCVDNVPAGMHGEVRTALESLGDQRPLSVLILRDVLDDPECVNREWQEARAESAVESLFEEIWCFGDEDDVSSLVREGPLTRVTKPIVTCGRLGLSPVTRRSVRSASSPSANGQRKMVLVTTGGGGDGAPLVENYVCAVRRLKGVRSHIVLGPDFPDRSAASLPPNPSPRLRVDRFVPDLERCFDQADLVVSMAGYNTVCEILEAGCKAILVPRIYPRREQFIRAKRLSDRGRVTLLDPRSLSPRRLADAIEVSFADGRRFTPERQAGGRIAADRTAQLLGLDLHRMVG